MSETSARLFIVYATASHSRVFGSTTCAILPGHSSMHKGPIRSRSRLFGPSQLSTTRIYTEVPLQTTNAAIARLETLIEGGRAEEDVHSIVSEDEQVTEPVPSECEDFSAC